MTPRTAQAAMRHSSIDLTMNVYTDPRLLDVHGAGDVLPALPLNKQPREAEPMRATGTDSSFRPGAAPNEQKRPTQPAGQIFMLTCLFRL